MIAEVGMIGDLTRLTPEVILSIEEQITEDKTCEWVMCSVTYSGGSESVDKTYCWGVSENVRECEGLLQVWCVGIIIGMGCESAE